MRTPIPVQVEPLSAARWAKIERAVLARLEQEPQIRATPEEQRSWPARRAAWVLAAAAAFGLLLLVGQRFTSATVAVDAHQASRITTGPNPSRVALPGLTVDVDPESAVVIGDEPERGTLVVVDRGSIVCDVAPRAPRSPLIVQAGAAQVRVVGTRFRVTRWGEAARVEVEHGVVEVMAHGRTARVVAGQVWPAPARVEALPSAAPALVAPLPSVEVAAPVRRPAGRAKLPESREVSASEDSPQARFERAASLERSDAATALSLYRSIEGGSSTWAQYALFAHGRLEAARGHAAEGRRVLGQYLARFPNGANAADARAVLERLK